MEFEFRQVSPEEDLYNNAMSIIHGYQRARLGRRQRRCLDQLLDHQLWRMAPEASTRYDDRSILKSLQRRALVQPKNPYAIRWSDWELTPLGAKVAELLRGSGFVSEVLQERTKNDR